MDHRLLHYHHDNDKNNKNHKHITDDDLNSFILQQEKNNKKINNYIENAVELSERGETKQASRKYKIAKEAILANLTHQTKQNIKQITKNRPQTAFARLERKKKINRKNTTSNNNADNIIIKSTNISKSIEAKKLNKLKCKYLPINKNGLNIRYLKTLKGQYFPCDQAHANFLHKKFVKINKNWQSKLQLKLSIADEAIAAFELLNNDDDQKAEEILLKAFRLEKELLQTSNHEILARTLHNLGCLKATQNQFKEAENYFSRALQMRKCVFKTSQKPYRSSKNDEEETLSEVNHIEIAESLNDLGCVRLSLNVPTEECEKDLHRALKMRERILHPLDPLITESYFNLSMSNLKGGRRSNALSYMRKCLLLRKRNRDTAGVIKCSMALSDICGRDLHLYREALDLLLNASTLQQDFFNDILVEAEIFHRISRLHFSHQKYELAKEYGQRAIEKIKLISTQQSRVYQITILNDMKLIEMRLEAKRLYLEKLELEKRLREGHAGRKKKKKKKKRRKKKRSVSPKRRNNRGRRNNKSRSRSPKKRSQSPRKRRSPSPKSKNRRIYSRPMTAHHNRKKITYNKRRPQTSGPNRKRLNRALKFSASPSNRKHHRSIESLGSSLPSGTLSQFTMSTELSSQSIIRDKKKKPMSADAMRKKENRNFEKNMQLARKRYEHAEKERIKKEEEDKKRKEEEEKDRQNSNGPKINKTKYILKKNKQNDIGNMVWISAPQIIIKPPGYVNSDTSFILRSNLTSGEESSELVQW